MNTLRHALSLIKADISVIPIKTDGSKEPAIRWKTYQKKRMTVEEAERLFSSDCGVGIVAGAISGNLEVIDVEGPEKLGGLDLWPELSALIEETRPGLLDRCPQSATPSGGRHIFFRCSSIQGNQKLANRADVSGHPEVLIETRGEGGQVLAPGCPAECHSSGKLYTLVHGRITETPEITPEEREILLDGCRSFNTWTPPQTHCTQAGPHTGGRPGDDYNARGPVLAELENAGWAIESQHGEEYHLRRPGKKNGVSAIWHADERFLYVFSSNAYPFDLNEHVRPFRIYALLQHGGDNGAAARALKSKGFGAPSRCNQGPIAGSEPDALAAAASGALPPAAASTLTQCEMQTYLLNSSGALRPVLANAITMLREPDWHGLLAFDDFSERVMARKPPPWARTPPAQWGDHEVRKTTEWMQRKQLFVTTEVVGQACQTVAKENPFHPVREYLDSLVWDGVHRLSFWAERYLGSPGTPYTQAVSKCWMISGVARIHQPGCKADHVLIMEGPQGSGKSSAVRILADQWFSDELSDLGSKDASMQTKGVWIIELAELGTLSRSDDGAIKAYMSRSTDRFRPPYGKHVIDSPRQCIFAGTVNHSSYLRDETGGRRFWPVKCGRIDLDTLARHRDQLWAEAVHLYRTGTRWWLEDENLNALAAGEQADRFDGDPWEEIVASWLEEPTARSDNNGYPFEPFTSTVASVTVNEVLIHCIGKCRDQLEQRDMTRIARILQAKNWERKRERTDGGSLAYRYRPRREGQG